MQSTVLPVTSPTFASFLLVTIGLVIILWLVLTLLLKIRWARQKVTAWIEPNSAAEEEKSLRHERRNFHLKWRSHSQEESMGTSDLEEHRVSEMGGRVGEPAVSILVP